jgi:hypothetical protein
MMYHNDVYLIGILNVIVLSSIVLLPTTTSLINFSYLPSTNLYNHHCPNNLNKRNQYHPFFSTTRPLSLYISAMSSQTKENDNDNDNAVVVITDLARYAIKGLSGDKLSSVLVPNNGVQTFPDDRRFALLKKKSINKFDENDPQWLFKDNFLCAFTAPELLASFQSKYEIVQVDDNNNNNNNDNNGATVDNIKRLLTLYNRDDQTTSSDDTIVLGPIDLNLQIGRDELASFFSKESKEELVCVTNKQKQQGADDINNNNNNNNNSNNNNNNKKVGQHTFQFGNTRAGVKNNPDGDTRLVHIVNKSTVREFSDKIGMDLNAMRFRPNIIIDGLEPWKEFDWVGRTVRVVSSSSSSSSSSASSSASGGSSRSSSTLIMKILSTTVRCEGIGIDPLDPNREKVDIPKLLAKHYPEYGPYLGVYASLEVIDGNVDGNGNDIGIDILLSVGDTLELL